jgi:hypothetical protein
MLASVNIGFAVLPFVLFEFELLNAEDSLDLRLSVRLKSDHLSPVSQ